MTWCFTIRVRSFVGFFKTIWIMFHLHGFKKNHKCYKITVLEPMGIAYDDLDIILSTNGTNIMVELNCLEVVNLLNDKSTNFFEVSFSH